MSRESNNSELDNGGPVLDLSGGRPRPRRNYARWRALSLSLVYVVFAVHIIHWKLTGKTLAPLELNEVMYTLELGIITAAFLFMCTLVLGTLLFGRFFCSWACHIMVLQDLCAWLLRKLKIRPKPIRSRVLLWVPPLTACYMFIWPQILRTWHNHAFPTFHLATDREGWASFVTNNFWRNLPTPGIIVLTFLVCGFGIVYLLGSRTFCTYVCPYGAVFALADRFSPGRIRVNQEKCQQCGTCTAACTSGVRVHEEVKKHGKIVNPACLKDLDCVAACPQDALSYRFSTPALFKSYTSGGRFGLPYDFSRAEELLIAIVFVIVLLSFRGLYSRLPFLFSLGGGAIIGYFAVVALRLLTRTNVSLSTLRLKSLGRLTPQGSVFAAFFVVLAAFVGHSSFVRYHEYNGLRQTRAFRTLEDPAEANALAARAADHLATADRWGLVHNVRVERGLISTSDRLGRFDVVETYALRLLERDPDDAWVRLQLARSLGVRGQQAEAEQQLRTITDRWANETDVPVAVGSAHQMLAGLLGQRGDYDGAVDELRIVLSLDPEHAATHAQLAGALAELGEFDAAIASLREAIRLNPAMGEAYCTILARLNGWNEVAVYLQQAVADAPDDADLHNNVGVGLMQVGKLDLAHGQFEHALAIDPQSADAHFNLGRVLAAQHRPDQASEHFRAAARLDPHYADLMSRSE